MTVEGSLYDPSNNYFVILLLFFLSFFNFQFPRAPLVIVGNDNFFFYFAQRRRWVWESFHSEFALLSRNSYLSVSILETLSRRHCSIGNNCVLFLSGLSRLWWGRKSRRKFAVSLFFSPSPLLPIFCFFENHSNLFEALMGLPTSREEISTFAFFAAKLSCSFCVHYVQW